MRHDSRTPAWSEAAGHVVGLDLSDKQARVAELDGEGRLVREGTVALTEAGLRRRFGGACAPLRVALEVGTHSPWVSRLLQALGHEVVVANPRQVALIFRSPRKTDRLDAQSLARLARVDPALLHPIRHRSATAQADLAQIRARAALVEARTALINHVRGAAKALGTRLPSCDAGAFHRLREEVPEALRPALWPLLEQIGRLTAQIKRYDRALAQLADARYPASAALSQVPGVGTLTALTFVLTLEDAARFPQHRAVGAYLGLVPRQAQSGARCPELSLTKAGDPYLRQLLVQCAHYILGPFGPDCDLRRWGLRLAGAGTGAGSGAGSGGGGRKKRALAAVARKLAVLLLDLWATGAVYEPLYEATRRQRREQTVTVGVEAEAPGAASAA